MHELFLAEWRRFRGPALVFCGVHLLVQLVIGQLHNVLEMRWQVHMLMLLALMACALAFALYQFGVYRQPGRWIWLLHRPLPRVRIFAALAGASALLVALAAGLPALLAVLGTKAYTARVVDLRHLALVLHLLLLSIIGWLAGAIIILSRTRAAVAVLALPLVLLGHHASGFTMLVPALACTGLLLVVAYGAFKPDRQAPPARAAVTAATAFTLQVGIYLALVYGSSLLIQSALLATGSHPSNRADTSGYLGLMRASGRQAMQAGLAAAPDARVPRWRTELAGADIGWIYPLVRQYPVRHQASNLEVLTFADPAHTAVWTFSHDAMRFRGRDVRSGKDLGWFGLRGIQDRQPFPAVPEVARGDWILGPQHLWQVDFAHQSTRELIRLTAPEALVMPARPVGRHTYTLTNQRLLAHRDADGGSGLPGIGWSVPLAAPLSDLGRIDVADLSDGTLLSFNFGRRMADGGPPSAQTLVFVGADHRAQVVARRVLAHDFPVLFEHRAWWLSPLLDAAVSLPALLLDEGLVPDQGLRGPMSELSFPRPPSVLAAAALCALLAALGAHHWLRASALSARTRLAWVLLCALLGPPALFSLMALQPRARPLPASGGAVVAPA